VLASIVIGVVGLGVGVGILSQNTSLWEKPGVVYTAFVFRFVLNDVHSIIIIFGWVSIIHKIFGVDFQKRKEKKNNK
jgi:hypothetical protein